MAEQTAIDYESIEWKDDAAGGTPIEAAALNHMEQGISNACSAVDELRTKRLPTYLVATGGDEATQDVYQEAILGPCLIVDLSRATTYYDNGEDGEGHERTKLTSGADIDELRDSLSRMLPSKGVLPTGTDLNDLMTPGVYVTQPGIDNLPSGGDGWGVVVVFNPNPNNTINCTQLYLGPMTKSRWTAGPYGNWYGWSQLSLSRFSLGSGMSAVSVTTYATGTDGSAIQLIFKDKHGATIADIQFYSVGILYRSGSLEKRIAWQQPSLSQLEDSGWVNAPHSSRYRRKNGVLYIEFKGDTVVAGDQLLFTLPEGFRPDRDQGAIPVSVVSGDAVGKGYVGVYRSGEVRCNLGKTGYLWTAVTLVL